MIADRMIVDRDLRNILFSNGDLTSDISTRGG